MIFKQFINDFRCLDCSMRIFKYYVNGDLEAYYDSLHDAILSTIPVVSTLWIKLKTLRGIKGLRRKERLKNEE